MRNLQEIRGNLQYFIRCLEYVLRKVLEVKEHLLACEYSSLSENNEEKNKLPRNTSVKEVFLSEWHLWTPSFERRKSSSRSERQ